MHIRRATQAEAPAVTALIAEFFAADGFTPDPGVVTMRAAVFLEDDRVVAFLAVS